MAEYDSIERRRERREKKQKHRKILKIAGPVVLLVLFFAIGLIVTHDNYEAVPEHAQLAVVKASADLYEKDDTGSKALKKVQFGDKLSPEGYYKGWYRIDLEDGKAFVRKADVVQFDQKMKHVALTFDDGPKADTTRKIQKALQENSCRATFFQIGKNINEKNGKLLRKGSKLGFEYGNHTNNHKDLTKLSEKKIRKQLAGTDRKVKKYTGHKTTLVRVPYGDYNDKVLAVIGRPNIMWTLDTRDWEQRNTKKLIKVVRKNVKDGQIVLLHEIYDSTADAVDAICKDLKEQGFEAVTVTELAAIKGTRLMAGKSYEGF